MRAAVPWSRYQLDLTRSPLILLSMPQHNATQHTHTHCPLCATRPVPNPATAPTEPKWRLSLSSVPGAHTHTTVRLMVTGQPGLSATCQCPAPVLTTGTTGTPPLSFYLFLHHSVLLFPASLYQDLWYSLWFHPTYLGIDSYLLPPALLSLSGLSVSSLIETNLPCNVILSPSSLWRYSFFPFLLRSCLFLPSVPPVILWLLFPSTPFTAKATPANASRSGHSLTPAAQSRGVWDGHRCGGGVPWCWRLRDASLCNLSVYMCVWFKCVCPLLLLALICV